MTGERGLFAADFSSIENRFSWRFALDSRTYNDSARRVEKEKTPGTLSWPTLKGALAENVVPRQAPEVVERDEGVVVEEGTGITRMKRRKNSTRRPAARLVGGKHLTPRVTAPSVRAVARRNTNPSAALIGSAACELVKASR